MKKNTIIVLLVLFLTSTVGVVDGAMNIINNPGFESGTASWSFYTNGVGAFSAASPGYEGSYAGRIALSSIGSNMQLFQSGRTLEANTRYRLTFSAYSTTGHDVSVILIKSVSPYTNYGLSQTINLNASWQTFTTEFITSGFTGTVSDGRFVFRFNGFASASDVYYIDAIVLEKVGADTSQPTVVGNTPTGTGVPVNTQITVTFNESMNRSSAQVAFSTSPATTGSFSWSGNTMTYTPGSSLSAGATYTVTIGTGAKDLAGNSLQTPYSWQFTTAGGGTVESRLAALENRVTQLETENTALKNLLAGVSRDGNSIYIDGANLYIRDGSDSTDGPVNGLGNLIIGYNELRVCKGILCPIDYINNRTGSHNLIIGSRNNYRSYGGIIGGYWNDISGAYASISGGDHNKASGHQSSISGGAYNTASNVSSSVSGGQYNNAKGHYSSISGGWTNTASGDNTVVSGGSNNIAYGQTSSISGGNSNFANNLHSSISGGAGNKAYGDSASVSGGQNNNASGVTSSISGGESNTASNLSSSVSGGVNNIASGPYSSVSGGNGNKASSIEASSVSGGLYNIASGPYSSVSGGLYNTASGPYSSVSGGGGEPLTGQDVWLFGNIASGKASWVGGGASNEARGPTSSVSGGNSNIASSDSSSVSGGYQRTAWGTFDWVAGELFQNQ